MKSPEDKAREIVEECTKYWVFSADGNRQEVVEIIAAAIRHEREQRVVWPRKGAIVEKCNEIDRKYRIAYIAASDMEEWLKSKVKPFEMPEFSKEEIDYISRRDFVLDEAKNELAFYKAGFNKCLELIKQKLGE